MVYHGIPWSSDHHFHLGLQMNLLTKNWFIFLIIILLDSAQNFKGRVKELRLELTMLPLLQIYFDLL